MLFTLRSFLNGSGERYIKAESPSVFVPEDENPIRNIYTFIEGNVNDFAIYANQPLEFIPEGYDWVPYGHVYKLYAIDDSPSYETVSSKQDQIWQGYQDPLSGSLGQYKNLMLSNITDFYSDARVRTGAYAAKNNDHERALIYYAGALELDPDRGLIRYLMGDSLIALERCEEAEEMFEEGYTFRTDDEILYIESMLTLARDCYQDEELTAVWEGRKASFEKEAETQLQEL